MDLLINVLLCFCLLMLVKYTKGSISSRTERSIGAITGKQEGKFVRRRRYVFVTCSDKPIDNVDENQVHYTVNNSGNLFKNFWCKPLALLQAANEYKMRIVYRDLDFIPHKLLSPERLSRDRVHTEGEYGSSRSNAFIIVFGSKKQIEGYHSFMTANAFQYQQGNYDQDALNDWKQLKLAHPNGRLGLHFNSRIVNRRQFFRAEKHSISPLVRAFCLFSSSVALFGVYRLLQDSRHCEQGKCRFRDCTTCQAIRNLCQLSLVIGFFVIPERIASITHASTYYKIMQQPSKCAGYWEGLGLIGNPSVRAWKCGGVYQVGDPEGAARVSQVTFYTLNVLLRREAVVRLLYPGILRQFFQLSIAILIAWEAFRVCQAQLVLKQKGYFSRFYRGRIEIRSALSIS